VPDFARPAKKGGVLRRDLFVTWIITNALAPAGRRLV